jgi:hypothetical protein
MANDNDYADDEAADPGAGIGNGMIILTSLVLLIAVYMMWDLSAQLYNAGPLGN